MAARMRHRDRACRLSTKRNTPAFTDRGARLFLLFVLATSYSRLSTTIASRGLNCRVRKENGCDPSDKSPGQKEQTPSLETEERHKRKTENKFTRLPQFLSRVLSDY